MAAAGALALAKGGGGGGSPSASSSVGPSKSGDIGANNFSAGGINTGKQNSPSWVVPVVAGVVILAAVILLRKHL